MSLRCRLGLHDWSSWHTIVIRTQHIVHEQITQWRRPDEDFTTEHNEQGRRCRRCGVQERRKL